MSKHIGSTLDSLFEETGELDELDLLTRKKILAEQIRKRMTQIHLTQVMLAKAMHTSRTVVHRLLDPSDTGVTLETMAKAAKALDLELRVTFAKVTRPRRGKKVSGARGRSRERVSA
jgi:antitoxin HicB